MAKILVNKNGQALMGSDGKLYKGAVEQVIPEGYIKPTGKIEITSTEEINVSQYEKAQVVDSNLVAENIVKDVTILGVTGTLEGGSGENTLETYLLKKLSQFSSNEITEIGSAFFSGQNYLKSVDLPLCTSVGAQAFYLCSELESVNLPLVTNLSGNSIFRGCSKLVSIDLPSVTTMSGSFQYCEMLKSVKLACVVEILSYTFWKCKALTDIYLGANQVVTLGDVNVFKDVTAGIKVHVRSEYADQYATATNWSSLIANGTIVIVGDYSD